MAFDVFCSDGQLFFATNYSFHQVTREELVSGAKIIALRLEDYNPTINPDVRGMHMLIHGVRREVVNGLDTVWVFFEFTEGCQAGKELFVPLSMILEKYPEYTIYLIKN